jgi:hypothetical protein
VDKKGTFRGNERLGSLILKEGEKIDKVVTREKLKTG